MQDNQFYIITNLMQIGITIMKLLNNINVFGRENEITTIKSKLLSNTSEFIAIYGKRRVGKTFLISNLLSDLESAGKIETFRIIGTINSNKKITYVLL